MSRYEGSIKCKYCSHFEPGVNRCHLYHDFDQSLDKHCDGYLKETSPNDVCESFALTAMDTVARGVSNRRGDGSYIVTLEDDPELKAQLKKEVQSYPLAVYLFGGLLCGWIIGLWLNTAVKNTEIIKVMAFWGAVSGVCIWYCCKKHLK